MDRGRREEDEVGSDVSYEEDWVEVYEAVAVEL